MKIEDWSTEFPKEKGNIGFMGIDMVRLVWVENVSLN